MPDPQNTSSDWIKFMSRAADRIDLKESSETIAEAQQQKWEVLLPSILFMRATWLELNIIGKFIKHTLT